MEALYGVVPETYYVGDCKRAASITEATTEAYFLGCEPVNLSMGGGAVFIRQIINNNVVLVRDTGGKELIVVAKGIGYHGRTGAAVDLKRYPDHRLFVPDDAEHARIRQIYNEIPEDQFDLAVQLLQMEQQARGMDGSIPITAALMLADHLHEMVARLKNGLELHNALTNEIMMFYKKEFEISRLARSMLTQNYGVRISDDELAFIATHLINLGRGNLRETVQSLDLVHELVDIVRHQAREPLERDSYNYSRFITHLKYFSLRVIDHEKPKSTYDEKLSAFVRENFRQAYDCAQQMRRYVLKRYSYEISDDEVIYLTLHLEKLFGEG